MVKLKSKDNEIMICYDEFYVGDSEGLYICYHTNTGTFRVYDKNIWSVVFSTPKEIKLNAERIG